MQLSERIFYNENINHKLSANNVEVQCIYFYVFRKDNTEYYVKKG